MEKITIKELVEFRTKSSDKSKRNFALKLKTRKAKEKKEEDKNGVDEYYDEKIKDILDRHKKTDSKKDCEYVTPS